MNARGKLVSAGLAALWVVILAWQVFEHQRVQQSARVALMNQAKDISTTVGIVMRSQRRFGVISRERLESALAELVRPGELSGVVLLNAAGAVVASAGAPVDLPAAGTVRSAEYWQRNKVTLVNLVDLGGNLGREPDNTNPPIVLSQESFARPPETNRPPPPPREPGEHGASPDEGMRPPPPTASSSAIPGDASDNSGERPRSRGRDRDGRPRFGRPFWMSEEDYRAMLERQGAHSFVISLSTAELQATVRRDFWMRLLIGGLATVSVVGFGLAWRNLARTSELEVRLVRAAEQNTRLKDMNFAAAGLAHETKNPLNIIRGLAQMISKSGETNEEVRQKSRNIMDEADRVTAQLNEFINYSRPREVRRVTVGLNAAVAEVVHALGHDLEDKAIRVTVAENLPAIEADEQLLRQVLFNLLLNATQALERGGEISVTAARTSATEAALEVRDNGPGVPAELRKDIFKPYFTTTLKGTGLGLAVVHQIVLAHGWEIECLANQPRGAVFRISHLRLAGGA